MVSNEPRSTEPARDPGSGAADIDAPSIRRIAPDTAQLAPLRSWLDEQLADDLDAEARQLLLVAVTEAVTNAMEAHRRRATDLPIQIAVDLARGLVTIDDQGGGLGPDGAADLPTPPPSAARGRGLLIIQSICPDARIVETGVGTRVELPLPR